jgi:hypothetical protein
MAAPKNRVIIKGFGFHFEGEGQIATSVLWIGGFSAISGRLITLGATLFLLIGRG